MNEKIIQIIKAPKGFYAVYDVEDGEMESEIVCIGLDEEGGVYFMDYDQSGLIESVNSCHNFNRIIKK